jgi:predicted phosphodiesterase
MTSTWFLGDIHGCAEELHELVAKLQLGPEDRLIALGDLYHRGPDPHGVARLLADIPQLNIVFGNHELVLLQRAGMMPLNIEDPPIPLPESAHGYDADDLSGDGGTPIFHVDPEHSAELLHLLHAGRFFFRGNCEAGPHQGRPWLAVHAGIIPGKAAEACTSEELCRVRRIGRRRTSPFWYEKYRGHDLVVFGHTHAQLPRRHMQGPHLAAHGLDTGCVYGGCLTAWCLETDDYEVVAAKRDWYSEYRR